MNLPIIFRHEAELDVRDAFAWYEEQRAGLGSKFADSIEETLKRIGENPQLYATVEGDLRRASTRRFPYVIFYRISGDSILVVAVFHASRNPDAWQVRA